MCGAVTTAAVTNPHKQSTQEHRGCGQHNPQRNWQTKRNARIVELFKAKITPTNRRIIKARLFNEHFECTVNNSEQRNSAKTTPRFDVQSHSSCVSAFLHATHELEVGRARKRCSSIGFWQYLQTPYVPFSKRDMESTTSRISELSVSTSCKFASYVATSSALSSSPSPYDGKAVPDSLLVNSASWFVKRVFCSSSAFLMSARNSFESGEFIAKKIRMSIIQYRNKKKVCQQNARSKNPLKSTKARASTRKQC